jgi:hypothetical protein
MPFEYKTWGDYPEALIGYLFVITCMKTCTHVHKPIARFLIVSEKLREPLQNSTQRNREQHCKMRKGRKTAIR